MEQGTCRLRQWNSARSYLILSVELRSRQARQTARIAAAALCVGDSMANTAGVWGIDIGRCALKALRCRLDGDAVVADGFDYIEYPKLLTQQDADAPQLVKEALEQFLTRNSLKGDKVAISVSGESGLARYFKPPPVDVKKIADIVKYEAKQQIPFALEDVIWDFQRMAGGQEVEGFALDTEIGLFAMKREQVAKALVPYNTAMIEVDIIQLAPIAIYNYVSYDVTTELPEGTEYDSENPPPSIVVLSIGTDTTDLVITNGYRVWQRNIPLGGNHFTKQLSKELKLTFAKAEHLKRNPKQADDPKAVFQAMRPVFADMVTEVQRSIGFFQSLDRKAKIESIVMLGNTVKLPGLVQYLSKHLGYPVKEIESFKRMTGSSVVTAPSFKDNLLAFGGCFGLCLQGLGKGKLSTNLLPREILTQRMIKAKKPWAVAGVAALVLAVALNFVFYSRMLGQVHPDTKVNEVTWKQGVEEAKAVAQYSSGLISEDKAKLEKVELLKKISNEVIGASDRRVLWLELMRAINTSLPPMDESLPPGAPVPDPQKLDFKKRKDLKIEYIETQFFPELSAWFNDRVKTKWLEINPEAAKAAGADPAAAPVQAAPAQPDPTAGMDPQMAMMQGGGNIVVATTDVSGINIKGPSGPGWVIELKGHHFFNDPRDRRNTGRAHVINTLIKNLEHGFIDLPAGPGQGLVRFSMKDLGISHVILAYDPPLKNMPIPNPNYVPVMATEGAAPFGTVPTPTVPGTATTDAATAAAANDPKNKEFFIVPRYDFVVQFCWVEKPLNVRLVEREARLKAEAEAAQAAAAAAAATDPNATTVPPATAVPATTTPATPTPATTPPATATPASPAPAATVPPASTETSPAPAVTPPPDTAVPDSDASAPPTTPGAAETAPAPTTPAPAAIPPVPDAAP